MRTAAIGMFFTHYITLREQPPVGGALDSNSGSVSVSVSGARQQQQQQQQYNREPTQLSRRDAAVLHFKDIHNLEASGSIFGATLPVDPSLKRRECQLVPERKENVTAAWVLDSLTKLALPYLESRYVSQLTEIHAFEV